jgi:hypothetical protein
VALQRGQRGAATEVLIPKVTEALGPLQVPPDPEKPVQINKMEIRQSLDGKEELDWEEVDEQGHLMQ